MADDFERLKALMTLIDLGYEDQITLGHDFSSKIMRRTYGNYGCTRFLELAFLCSNNMVMNLQFKSSSLIILQVFWHISIEKAEKRVGIGVSEKRFRVVLLLLEFP